MLEALGDLTESCRLIKSQLPPSPPHPLSTSWKGHEGVWSSTHQKVPEKGDQQAGGRLALVSADSQGAG